MVVWFNGDYVAKEKVTISPDDRGFLFGDGVYEMIRSYDGRLFKFAEHLQRRKTSEGMALRQFCFPINAGRGATSNRSICCRMFWRSSERDRRGRTRPYLRATDWCRREAIRASCS